MGAEIIGAPGTWEKGCEVIGRYLSEIGIEKDSFVLGNGSGLNDENRLTPIQVTKVLEAMYKHFELRAEFVSSLAVAGVSGTITRRFLKRQPNPDLEQKQGLLQASAHSLDM